MIYKGEQLLWGQLGHFFVVLAVVTAIFSVIANYCRTKDLAKNEGWKITARGLYLTHAFAVFGIFITLLLMVFNHRFEYQYVWQHSKRDMSMNYILACIWEGQEGSTLLWLIWHSVIGLILMRRAKDWEAPVMTVLSLVQVFLSMMLLGLYIGKVHIGSNPFELIRLKEDNIGLPWTKISDYLTNPKTPLYHDGRGLNPLLQNYWMTIHPPTLFLGFALCTIPFAFAIAGLWTKRFYDWQKPALPWAYTGVMILGTGILMGGAWAYESLSFGGFWAWDPVENASLVPWLVLVGAAHVMLLYRNKGQSLFTTFFLCIAAFLLIVYSTFLTKSGILSDTSVHAFTDDGLNEELTAFMGFFLWLSVFLLSFNRNLKIIYTGVAAIVLVRFLEGNHGSSMLLLLVASVITIIIGYNKYFPKENKEEELWSREFWMFIGSLILLVASFQIIFYTSSPVVNKFLQVGPIHDFSNWLSTKTGWGWAQKLAEAKIAPDKDSVFFYNRWQVPFAFLVTILVAVTQYFKYIKTGMAEFRRQIRAPFIISIIITIPLIFIIYFNDEYSALSHKKQYMFITCSFLLFGTIFAIAANFNYWLKIYKGKIKSAGSSIAHVGFGILLLGVVISTSKKETISKNPRESRMDLKALIADGNNDENIYLRRGDTLPMGKYFVTYTDHQRRYKNGTPYVYYNVDFLLKDANGQYSKDFSLSPFYQINRLMGNAAEPSTKHYLSKDIYTFVKFPEQSSLEDTGSVSKRDGDLFDKPQNHTVIKMDTISLDNCIAVYKGFTLIDSTDHLLKPNEYGVTAHFQIFDQNMAQSELEAKYFIDTISNTERQIDGVDEKLGVKFTFWKIHAESDPRTNKIDVFTAVQLSKKSEYIVLEAAIFPGINVLWIGCLIMVAGTFLAIRDRIKKNKITAKE
jgi:cytochrome c-type biogenesis protein CcmF